MQATPSTASQTFAGGRIVRLGDPGIRPRGPLASELAPLEAGSPVEGVWLEAPSPDTAIEWALYPSPADGLAIEVEGP